MTTPALPLAEVPGMPRTTPWTVRTWRFWFAPRPFTLVTTFSYVLLLVFWFDRMVGHTGTWGMRLLISARLTQFIALPLALVMSSILLLLVIDRLEVWAWDDAVPRGVRIGLLLVRVVLTALVAYGLNAMTLAMERKGIRVEVGAWYGMYAYCMLPYVAAVYFGPRASIAASGVLVVYAATSLVPPRIFVVVPSVRAAFFESLGAFALVLLFVSVIARLVHDELRDRRLAEQLVATLAQAHDEVQRATASAVVATTERLHIARDVHEALGRALSVMAMHIDAALGGWAHNGNDADEAVQVAKQLGSSALQEVRNSVRILRGAHLHLHTFKQSHLPLRSGQAQRRAWVQWLAPRPLDLLVLIWYTVVVVGISANDAMPWHVHHAMSSHEQIVFTGVLLAMLVLDRLDYRLFPHHRPRAAALLLMVAHLVVLLVLMMIDWEMALAFVVPFMPYIGFLYGSKHIGWWFSAFAWVGFMSVTGIALYRDFGATSTAFGRSGAIMLGIFSFVFLVIVMSLTTALDEHEQRTRVEETITSLEHAYVQQRRVSDQVVEEQQARNRLARDIHDGLGHYLTVINVQLEKALAFRLVDPTIAHCALQDARRLTDDALREVQDVTATFTTAPAFSFVQALEALVQHLSATCAVDLQIVGDVQEVGEQAQLALYRVAQEGITNIQKHAQATKVTIQLVIGETDIQLLLCDNGSGFEQETLVKVSAGSVGGFGLTGMRERLEIVGGSIDLETRTGEGTCLRAQVLKQALVGGRTGADSANQVQI